MSCSFFDFAQNDKAKNGRIDKARTRANFDRSGEIYSSKKDPSDVEEFKCIDKAIATEKKLKKWVRKKKSALIEIKNPRWEFMNKLFSMDSE